MQNSKKSWLLRLSLVLIVFTLVFSSFTGCTETNQTIASKEDIYAAIDTVSSKADEYEYVHLYLKEMGIVNYNVSKMLWAEIRFQAYFNIEGGLPETHDHARMTALLFVNDFYDNIDTTNSTEVTDALITCYVATVGDEYSIYRTPAEHTAYDDDMSGKFGGIGVVIEYDHEDKSLIVSSVYIDSPAEKAGIQPGDYIIGVDGKTVEELGYLNVVYYVRGEIGSTVTIKINRNGNILDLSMERAEVSEKTVDYQVLDNNIGYVQIVGFKANTHDQFVEAVDALEELNVKGIIFDLRGNPGGYVDVVCNMISYLVPKGQTMVSYQYKGSDVTILQSQDDVHPTKKMPNDSTKPLVEDHVLDLPMVILCNEYTASAGELFTAAMRDYDEAGLLDAVIVGQKTFGKGIMQTSWTHIDGSSITMTIAYYNPPSNKNYHGAGITPHRVVDNELVDGVVVDKQIETAIKEMKSLISAN